MEQPAPSLPPLKIRHLTATYPIIQGGMGIGVSWDRLAGNVARNGCVGIVSAIGTGYRYPGLARTLAGRPDQPENLQNGEALRRILQDALATAAGHGPVGVNILCAINEYERVVREAVAAGAQLVISGAGLPLALPEYVGDRDVALVPIVSSARALRLICKTWQKKFQRLPDAVVLEGPESGGHQGFSLEQCADPAFALDALLPQVVEERNQWGDFPVIAAGGVWDRSDIDRLLAMGRRRGADGHPLHRHLRVRRRPAVQGSDPPVRPGDHPPARVAGGHAGPGRDDRAAPAHRRGRRTRHQVHQQLRRTLRAGARAPAGSATASPTAWATPGPGTRSPACSSPAATAGG